MLRVPLVRRRSDRNDLDSLDRERDQHLIISQERLDEATHELLYRLDVDHDWRGESTNLDQQAALWSRIQATRSRPATYALLNLAARSTDSLAATAAATALAEITRNTSPLSWDVLRAASNDSDPDAAAIARTALTGPQLSSTVTTPLLDRQTTETASTEDEAPSAPETERSDLSTCVHGTWSRHRTNRWYAPRSQLHQHIKDNATPNLYDGRGYFRWTGGYGDDARASGASDLSRWRATRGVEEFDTVYAHSHGGNVALEAASKGERIHLLVLLHSPILPRSPWEWGAISRNVGRVYSLRSRADLVMLADGLRTGSTLDLPAGLLPGGSVKPHWRDPSAYFAHDYYLRLRTWNDFDIASDIVFERGLAG